PLRYTHARAAGRDGGPFLFQAEDGIRDFHVTGVQTCALPISAQPVTGAVATGADSQAGAPPYGRSPARSVTSPKPARRCRSSRQIGRASGRGRGWAAAGGGADERTRVRGDAGSKRGRAAAAAR